jgi:hypothetical protein
MSLYDQVADITLPELSGIGKAILTRSDIFGFLASKSIGAKVQNNFSRELSLGSTAAAFVTPGAAVTPSVATTDTLVTDRLAECIASVNIPRALAAPAEKAYQLASKAKDVTNVFLNGLIQGSGSTTIDGFRHLCTGAHLVEMATAGTGSVLTLAKCDELYNAVATLAEPTFFMANRKVIDQYRALVRANAGGLAGNAIQMKTFDGENRTYLTIQGVPLVPCDWITVTEPSSNGSGPLTYSSMYACYSNVVDGAYLWYSTVPGNELFQLDGPNPVYGANADNYNVIMDVGFSVSSLYSIARLAGILVS